MRSILQMNVSFKAVLAILAVAALVWVAATGFYPGRSPQFLTQAPQEQPLSAATSSESPSAPAASDAWSRVTDSSTRATRARANRQQQKKQRNGYRRQAKAAAQPRKQLQQKASTGQAVAPKSKPAIQDPVAREALALVGSDPAAEQYWLSAINDLSLSDTERQDLIEDLNEDGFTDARHPSPEDLPLIISRIELIEQVGPWAADQVNADAFQEAYKDLVNMAEDLMNR